MDFIPDLAHTLPGSQSMQDALDMDPRLGLYVPWIHAWQVTGSLGPRYLPLGHGWGNIGSPFSSNPSLHSNPEGHGEHADIDALGA